MEGFWNDTENASKIQKEKSINAETVKIYTDLEEVLDEFEILCEYADAGDEESANEAIELFPNVEKRVVEAEERVLLSKETDPNNAIVSINAGAGGTESCDWAMMISRMLTRYAEKLGFKIETIDVQPGDSAGIKSQTFMVNGPMAYGKLKSESGIHRLVRLSPFDSANRRHTSFASVYVSPEIDDSIEIEVEDKDLRIDVYRSGGAGGQSVNTTDSAVRLTHHPSGLVVTCQNERSQLQNRQTAMKVLKSRLYDLEMEKKRQEQNKVESEKKEIGWGSQIRSYVLHPYKMVKDHRTGFEVSSPDKVLDGDIAPFAKAYLHWDVGSDKGEF
jgi:peptide chain release factor 2